MGLGKPETQGNGTEEESSIDRAFAAAAANGIDEVTMGDTQTPMPANMFAESLRLEEERTILATRSSSIYSLFKPEPEARITCKVYRYPYSRFPTPLLSCGTTPLLNNIRSAVLRATHEARNAEVERSDQLGQNSLPTALT